MLKHAKRTLDVSEFHNYQRAMADLRVQLELSNAKLLCRVLNNPWHLAASGLREFLLACKDCASLNWDEKWNAHRIVESNLEELTVRLKASVGPPSNLISDEGEPARWWPPGVLFEYEAAYSDSYLDRLPQGSNRYYLDERQDCVLFIIVLANDFRLDSMRECESCRSWYFAARIDQRFCKSGCRRHEFNISESQRAKNAAYQRGRYANEKARNAAPVASKQLSKKRPYGKPKG